MELARGLEWYAYIAVEMSLVTHEIAVEEFQTNASRPLTLRPCYTFLEILIVLQNGCIDTLA